MNNILDNPEGIKIQELLEKLKSCADLYIFGGAARDNLFGKGKHKPKDYDIVYWGDKKELEKRTEPYLIKFNKMGGRKLSFKELDVDIWYIEDSHYLQKNRDFTLRALLNSTYSSLESVAYSYTQKRHYGSQRFWKTYNNNEINIINYNNFSPLKASLKIIKTSMLLGLKIDEKSSQNIRNVLHTNTHKSIIERWGKIVNGNGHESVIDSVLNNSKLIDINLKKHNLKIDRREIPMLNKRFHTSTLLYNL